MTIEDHTANHRLRHGGWFVVLRPETGNIRQNGGMSSSNNRAENQIFIVGSEQIVGTFSTDCAKDEWLAVPFAEK